MAKGSGMNKQEERAAQDDASFRAAFRRQMLIGLPAGGVPALAFAAWLYQYDEPVYGMFAGPVLLTTPLMAALGAGLAILLGTARKRR
jgi:hypothetical protein